MKLNYKFQYTLFGVIFGLCFPIVAWISDIFFSDLAWSFHSILNIHASNHLHYIIDTAPLFLGGAFWVTGIYRYKAEEINQNLENKVHKRTLALEKANHELQENQLMMMQAEKMSSLGILTAGIAHEINNPMNFISFGVSALEANLNDIKLLLEKYAQLDDKKDIVTINSILQSIYTTKQHLEYSNLITDAEELMSGIKTGTERITNIIRGLRSFSRHDQSDIQKIDIHKSIDTTLVILTHEHKHRITIHKKYADNIPDVECLSGQINQVFMNILANATQAIKEKGDITIETVADDTFVTITISDTGSGMSEETQRKLFDPFYTTKEIGKGTGLGLSISYNIIKEHYGNIEVKSQENVGSTFKIILPILHKEENTKSKPKV